MSLVRNVELGATLRLRTHHRLVCLEKALDGRCAKLARLLDRHLVQFLRALRSSTRLVVVLRGGSVEASLQALLLYFTRLRPRLLQDYCVA